MLKIRKKALRSYLQDDFKLSEIKVSEEDHAVLIYGDKEYLVVSDEEADERYANKAIRCILSFPNESIIQGSTLLENDDDSNELLDLMREHNIGNGAVSKLVDVPEAFVKDSKIGVGRGPILSTKEGVEHELIIAHKGDGYAMYIYELG